MLVISLSIDHLRLWLCYMSRKPFFFFFLNKQLCGCLRCIFRMHNYMWLIKYKKQMIL